jgi:uncharacterized protein
MDFEWDENKARANLQKHRLDFEDAIGLFDGPVLESRSDRHGEERWRALGEIAGMTIVVVYVVRGERRRIVSARRANRNERETYRQARVE